VAQFRFPKSSRLLKGFQFKALSQKAFCFKGSVLCIFWKKTDRKKLRLGITVTKKYADAVHRNRFKRHVREAFRQLAPQCTASIDLNVRPKALPYATYTFDELYTELASFFTLFQKEAPHAKA
jgi:ribonuclease P protein component